MIDIRLSDNLELMAEMQDLKWWSIVLSKGTL